MFNTKPQQTIGVIDLGTPEQKEGLYKFKELVASSAPVSLAPTSPERWKVYPKRNQASQSSCVYHARAKAAGILQEQATGEFVEYSASDYNKRSNRNLPAPSNEGAWPVEAFDQWRTQGIGLEALEPTNDKSAQELAVMKQSSFEKEVANVSKLDAYYALDGYDFDQIISTLKATGKPIPLGFFATGAEWNRNVPTILDPTLTLNTAGVRHEVCATPNFGIYNGEEGFTIEDSWGSTGIEGAGVRWITRSFFTKRNYIPGLVPTRFKSYEDMAIDPKRPSIKLTRDLEYGMQGPDVFALQQVLKYEGFFPANHTGSEYLLELTVKGIKLYQEKYGIVSSGTAETTGYGRVGPTTRADINKRFK